MLAMSHATPRPSATGYGQVGDDEAFQCPPHCGTGQPRAWFGRRGGVLAPHMSAFDAAVATHRDFQHGRPPAERLVREAADHAVANHPLAPTTPAPLVRLDNPTSHNSTLRLQALSSCGQAKTIKSSETGQIRAAEPSQRGNVRYVEVFWTRRVGTLIFRRLRHLFKDRLASPTHTLIWEEPFNLRMLRSSKMGVY